MSDDEAPPHTPKAEPETLVMRAQHPRAVRFRRGVIITAGALGSVALAAVAWTALKPVTFQHVAASEEGAQPNVLPANDALSRLPSSYADTPKLGPPLPGDLGRPILDHQRALTQQAATPRSGAAGQEAVEKRERRRAELKAARESAILFQSEPKMAAPSQAKPGVDGAAPPPMRVGAVLGEQKPMLDPRQRPDQQENKPAFVSNIVGDGRINPHRLAPAASPYMLSAGSVIPASLITGVRSDLPGLVIAQVTERIYDSVTGRVLLIPQGARLIGSYDSVVAFGQQRALIVWQRIVMPDGSSLELDNVPASDAAGYAGLEDMVDFHTWTLLKGAAITTLLGVGANLTFTSESDLIDAIRQSTQQNVSRAGDQLTSRNLQIQPTITIRPGASVRLVVRRDLVLAPWQR
jgi:type IV secretory pathway VirB10-like protein